MDTKDMQTMAKSVRKILQLGSLPVGVKFIDKKEYLPSGPTLLTGHRYCQALMKARNGAHVMLNGEGIACLAAAAAFGFKPLPEGLKTGRGLVGFGIVEDEAVGKTMFKGMTNLPGGKLKALYLYPLETATIEPDIIVVEDETEKLMWLAMTNLNIKGGQRVESSTAILQAACVDATLIPYVKQQFNMSLGCYGCRDATDIGPNETILGFPVKDFDAIVEVIAFLNLKAIPKSRGKNALALLKSKET